MFGNPVQMKQLTDIVWPEIHREIKERVSQFRSSPCTQDASLMVVEAAVLLEAGWIDFADAVWVTEVPEEIAVQRLMERNQLSREDALSRIRSQLSNERRREIANFVINTNRSKTETKEIVLQV